MEELKPCPFCGRSELEANLTYFNGSIECLYCGCSLSLPTKSPETQINHWNRRADNV